jgi:hypothetical protein
VVEKKREGYAGRYKKRRELVTKGNGGRVKVERDCAERREWGREFTTDGSMEMFHCQVVY